MGYGDKELDIIRRNIKDPAYLLCEIRHISSELVKFLKDTGLEHFSPEALWRAYQESCTLAESLGLLLGHSEINRGPGILGNRGQA